MKQERVRYFRYVNWEEAKEIIQRESIENWNAGDLRFVEITDEVKDDSTRGKKQVSLCIE